MTPYQVSQQFKHMIGTRRWGANPAADLVFGRAIATAGTEDELTQRVRFPMAWISEDGTEFDSTEREQGRLQRVTWTITVFVGHEGTGTGRALLVGGHRSGGLTSSKGRGLQEVREELIEVLASGGKEHGLSLKFFPASMAKPRQLDKKNILVQEFRISTACSNQRTYPTVARFAGTAGGGTATLTWLASPDRWDRVKYIVRRGSVGGPAPSSPTAGTDVAVGSSGLALTATDTPGAGGTYAYALFVAYDERGGGDPEVHTSNVYATAITTSVAV